MSRLSSQIGGVPAHWRAHRPSTSILVSSFQALTECGTQLAPRKGSNVREHAQFEHMLSKLLLPLLILSACDGGEAGSPTDPASPPASPDEADAGAPTANAGSSGPSAVQPAGAGWLPASTSAPGGTPESAGFSATPTDDADAKASGGGDGRCDEACGHTEVCDPASGGCVPHCAESQCVTGWSCDGRSGLCVPDRPECGRCREGQVCDPEVRVCVAHCLWAGCSEGIGRCDRETGFCVE